MKETSGLSSPSFENAEKKLLKDMQNQDLNLMRDRIHNQLEKNILER